MTQNGNSSSGSTPPTIATGNVEERLMVCKRSRMQIHFRCSFHAIVWDDWDDELRKFSIFIRAEFCAFEWSFFSLLASPGKAFKEQFSLFIFTTEFW